MSTVNEFDIRLPTGRYQDVVLVDALKMYKLKRESKEVNGYIGFLRKAILMKTPIGLMEVINKEVSELYKDPFSNSGDLDKLCIEIKMMLMKEKARNYQKKYGKICKDIFEMKRLFKEMFHNNITRNLELFLSEIATSADAKIKKKYDDLSTSIGSLASTVGVVKSRSLKINPLRTTVQTLELQSPTSYSPTPNQTIPSLNDRPSGSQVPSLEDIEWDDDLFEKEKGIKEEESNESNEALT